jgi:hypothetical protein
MREDAPNKYGSGGQAYICALTGSGTCVCLYTQIRMRATAPTACGDGKGRASSLPLCWNIEA